MVAAQRWIISGAIALACACLYPSSGEAAKRAFLVGITNYKHLGILTNAAQDAQEVANKLEGIGFVSTKVIVDEQATRTEFLKEWKAFVKTVNPQDEVVVFFSGHGIDVKGKNLLVPQDSPSAADMGTESAAELMLIPLSNWTVLKTSRFERLRDSLCVLAEGIDAR